MKKLITFTITAGALLLGAANQKQAYTGVISDDMCGADHEHMNVTPDPKCVRECVKHGSKYVLLTGGKVYKLSDQKSPEQFAGAKVKVTGTLYTKTGILAVDKIEAAK
ncbi:MAG TPA: DUF5818 domain-containing protein [Bryobacteraceae bacterium]|nr:DUF5818 domain-containing protein [Bryobacteraceae bacterium]